MPNWCNNSITITGPIKKIEDLYRNHVIQDADDETGLLNGMVPMPKELNDTTSPSDEPNWYDWRVSNWGTKWEVSSEGLEYNEDPDNGTAEITGWFDSAWAPPLTAFSTYLEANPDVSITCTYEEPGMDFCGVFEDGEDDCLEDVHTEVMDVLTGHKTLEETSALFQRMNDELDLINNRSQWYELDDINSAREERGLPELTEEEYEAMNND